MLDPILRPLIEAPALKACDKLVKQNIKASYMLYAWLVTGLLAAVCAAMGAYFLGFILIIIHIILNEITEGLARLTPLSRIESVLHITAPPIIFSLIVFLFGVSLNQTLGASFLLIAMIALLTARLVKEKHNLTNPDQNTTSGVLATLIGHTETALFLIAIFFFPKAFSAFAMLFGIACWVSASALIFATLTPATQGAEEPTAPSAPTEESQSGAESAEPAAQV